jgi:hypothetical protein
VLVDSPPVDLTVSFYVEPNVSNRTKDLTYWLARYNLQGEFLGFQELHTQLSACPLTKSDTMKMKEFGVVTKNECNFELFKLKTDAQTQLPLDANVFFELFLEDRNKNLVAVPVAISNFRDIDG